MYYLSFPSARPLIFESAGKFVCQVGAPHARRTLNSAVLLIGVQGTCALAQEGREYLLKPHTFQVLFPHREHYGTAPVTPGQSHFWCHVRLPEDTEISTQLPDFHSGQCVLPEFGALPDSGKYHILFHQLIDAAYQPYEDPALRQPVCDAYARILWTQLSNDFVTKQHATFSQRRALATRIQEWVRLHCEQPISARDVATALGYHGDYLTQVLKSETGMTVGDCIQKNRVHRAALLLVNSDLRIEEIAEQVGIVDEKYLTRLFKKWEGISPSVYRRAYFHTHTNYS